MSNTKLLKYAQQALAKAEKDHPTLVIGVDEDGWDIYEETHPDVVKCRAEVHRLLGIVHAEEVRKDVQDGKALLDKYGLSYDIKCEAQMETLQSMYGPVTMVVGPNKYTVIVRDKGGTTREARGYKLVDTVKEVLSCK